MLRREVPYSIPTGHGLGRSMVKVVIACAVLATLLGFVIGPNTTTRCWESPEDNARLETKRYVDEATPLWRRQHPTASCPPDLHALNGYTNKGKSIEDPWGNPYAYTCVDGDVRIASAGDDEWFGTADDIRSWE